MERKIYANRIVTHGTRPASEFVASPFNWRIHPKSQQDALDGVLQEVGWVQDVIVSARSGYVIDGHARIMLALKQGDETPVPYVEVDVSETEEKLLISTLDPISALAARDEEQLKALIAECETDNAAVKALLDELAGAKVELQEAPTGVAVFSDDAIIKAAFDYFRAIGFPYRKLPVHVSMQEINKLATTPTEDLLHSNLGYHVADTYHPHRFHASAEGMKSPFDGFRNDDLLKRAMKLALDNGYALPAEAWGHLWIVSGVQCCSNFRPGFALALYREYCPEGGVVLDTSTGYGGRLIGFMASGLSRYIGIDPNKPTHDGNLRMVDELGFVDKVELYNMAAEDMPVDKLAGRCDFAFTSPPYFSKEHYSDDDNQSWVRYKTGAEWRDGFLLPMMRLQYVALKTGSTAIVNIADVTLKNKTYPLVDWAEKSATKAGFELAGRKTFDLSRRFGAGQEDGVAQEAVLIFRKAENATP